MQTVKLPIDINIIGEETHYYDAPKDNEEYETGICCVAVPVFNGKNEVISSISLTGPIFRMKNLDFDIVAESLKEAADNISKDLMV